jgi:hypothetical protein
MRTLSLPSTGSDTAPDTWTYGVLGDHLFRDKTHPFARLLGWWSRHTSLPDAKPGATFAERERVGRTRIASPMMLFLAILLLLVAVIALLGHNPNLLPVVYTLYPIILLCLFLNRKGQVTWVGILLSLGLVGGMCMTLVITALHGGLRPIDTQILFLLFFDEMFFAMLLPIDVVFLVAGLNMLISFMVLFWAPHTPALTAFLAHGGTFSTLFRLGQIHVLVSSSLWILVKTRQEQTERANTAEELVRLQHDLSELASQQAEQQAALEQSIRLIIAVHTRVANGDLDARVPLTRNLVLWNVAGQLNNLITRYQKARQEVLQAEQIIRAHQQMMLYYPTFHQAVQQALREQRPFQVPKSETALDLFLRELNGVSLSPSSVQMQERA